MVVDRIFDLGDRKVRALFLYPPGNFLDHPPVGNAVRPCRGIGQGCAGIGFCCGGDEFRDGVTILWWMVFPNGGIIAASRVRSSFIGKPQNRHGGGRRSEDRETTWMIACHEATG
jgi:hypothetical protein